MLVLKPLVLLTLGTVVLAACATVQLAPEQQTRLSELQAFADQIMQDWGSVTLEAKIQVGLWRRLGADRPIQMDQWVPIVRSYRLMMHPELLTAKRCAERTVAHALEWTRQGYGPGWYVAPVWAFPLVVAAEAARARAAEEARSKVAAATASRLRQLRGWTDTEFAEAQTECQAVIGRLKSQESR